MCYFCTRNGLGYKYKTEPWAFHLERWLYHLVKSKCREECSYLEHSGNTPIGTNCSFYTLTEIKASYGLCPSTLPVAIAQASLFHPLIECARTQWDRLSHWSAGTCIFILVFYTSAFTFQDFTILYFSITYFHPINDTPSV